MSLLACGYIECTLFQYLGYSNQSRYRYSICRIQWNNLYVPQPTACIL